MLPYIFDIIIVAVLVFFAWRGAKKGLILTLCGLVGIFIAFFGARFISARFYQPFANIIEPGIYQAISGVEEEQPSTALPGSADPTPSTLPDSTEPDPSALPGSTEPDPSAPNALDELLDAIHDAGLFSGFANFLDDAVNENALQQPGSRTAAQILADYLADLVAKAGLFAVSFLLILLIWFLVGHALDLAFHLPILSAVNTAGGLILGLVKAVLLVIVLVWLGQLAGLIPAEPETPVLSLFTIRGLRQFLNRLMV